MTGNNQKNGTQGLQQVCFETVVGITKITRM